MTPLPSRVSERNECGVVDFRSISGMPLASLYDRLSSAAKEVAAWARSAMSGHLDSMIVHLANTAVSTVLWQRETRVHVVLNITHALLPFAVAQGCVYATRTVFPGCSHTCIGAKTESHRACELLSLTQLTAEMAGGVTGGRSPLAQESTGRGRRQGDGGFRLRVWCPCLERHPQDDDLCRGPAKVRGPSNHPSATSPNASFTLRQFFPSSLSARPRTLSRIAATGSTGGRVRGSSPMTEGRVDTAARAASSPVCV